MILALSFVACGGGAEGDEDQEGSSSTTSIPTDSGTTATTSATTTTTIVAVATSPAEADATLDEFFPPQCVELYIDYLGDLEPLSPPTYGAIRAMEEAEFDAFVEQVDLISDEYNEALAGLDCPDYDLSERLDVVGGMLETARNEVPGALPIIELFASFADYYDDIDISTGDCEADLASVREYTEGKTAADFDLPATQELLSLVSFLLQQCPDQQGEAQELLRSLG